MRSRRLLKTQYLLTCELIVSKRVSLCQDKFFQAKEETKGEEPTPKGGFADTPRDIRKMWVVNSFALLR